MTTNSDTVRAGDGGHLTFQPGRGAPSDGIKPPGIDGSFIFNLADGTEFMRISPTGDVVVRDSNVAQDVEVYRMFREWVVHCRAVLGRGDADGEDASYRAEEG